MAESFAEATAGSGLKWHSWTRTISASTVHAGFTLPDEYPYASYSAVASSTSVGTANDHLIELMAGSSLNVRIRRIHVEQSANATSASASVIQVIRLSSAGTGGTAVTPSKFDTADSASGATAMTLPTVKGTETSTLFQWAQVWRQTVATTGAQADDQFDWVQAPNQKPIIIPAGTANGICLKTVSAVAGATIQGWIEFVETAFV